MRKLFILLFVTTVFAQNSDFRKVNFGDSYESVKEKETMKLVLEQENTLMYEGNVGGIDTYLVYNFHNDSFYLSTYLFKKEHKSNRNGFIDDYNNIKKLLTKKYGKESFPFGKEYWWKNDLYQDDYEDWGMALAIGHLQVTTAYSSKANNGNDMELRHGLTGSNYSISHVVMYYDIKLSEIANNAKEESSLDDF
jgi:hypothetical protein